MIPYHLVFAESFYSKVNLQGSELKSSICDLTCLKSVTVCIIAGHFLKAVKTVQKTKHVQTCLALK